MKYEFDFAASDHHRRYYGSYYTPESIAQAVTDWAVRSPYDRILEPSFGDGVFVRSCRRRLSSLGATFASPRILGTDIDPAAVSKVMSAFDTRAPDVSLRCADFLAVEPEGDWSLLQAAIGNPPYVRHHLIEKGTIADMRRRDLALPGGSDLWCSFVMHSTRFLAPGGRLAFVLPGSFVFARYAQVVRERLAASFRETTSIRLAFRAFASAGAEERGIVVLCDGYGEGPSPGWNDLVAWDEGDLVAWLADTGQMGKARPASTAGLPLLLTSRPLGDLASIGIGFVTGANATFVVNDATRTAFDLPSDSLSPVVSRTVQTPGINFTREDHAAAAAENGKVWLFAPADLGMRHGPVRRYLARVSRTTRRKTLWFRKRRKWFQPEIGPRPDAVLTYMNHLGPRLILLEGAKGATNTFHAVTFGRSPADPSPQLIALAMLTSFAQLSAERVGRSYGGGVLKIEPSEARKIEIPVPEVAPTSIDLVFSRADALMKRGEFDAACDLADETILRPMLGEKYLSIRSNIVRELAEARSFRLHRPLRARGATR